MITLHGTMAGTLSAPAFRGTFGLARGTYNGTAVPKLLGRFGYADRQLVAHMDALRPGGASMMTVDGRIPINLALSGATGNRLLAEGMAVDLVADSLPLELIPQFTDVVSNLHGLAAGKIAMRGTLKRPSLFGALTLLSGTVTLNATGATLDNVGASVHMANDTVYVDSIAGWARAGRRNACGRRLRAVVRPAHHVERRGAAENCRDAFALMRGSTSGPFREVISRGTSSSRRALSTRRSRRRHLLGGDPQLFNVLDTAGR
jgi:hypothetical protein